MAQPLYIVIPCYNPFDNWDVELVQHVDALQNLLNQYTLHTIVVNDASVKGVSDENIDYLKKNLTYFKYISYTENKGKGYALREGVKTISEGLILYTDIDFPYKYDSMIKVLSALEQGSDIAVGTRNHEYYENTPTKRKWISKIVRFVFKSVFGLPITDTQCGLKGFNTKGQKVFLSTVIKRFLFDMEFIALASKDTSVVMTPVYVKLRQNVVFSKMNLKILASEFWNFLRIFLILFRRTK
jgi:glycosyltransferase involved in cell wall biosynthesis